MCHVFSPYRHVLTVQLQKKDKGSSEKDGKQICESWGCDVSTCSDWLPRSVKYQYDITYDIKLIFSHSPVFALTTLNVETGPASFMWTAWPVAESVTQLPNSHYMGTTSAKHTKL